MCHSVLVLQVMTELNPMFCEVIGNGVPLVGHMFVANGIAKEDLQKCFYHKELTKEELNKLGL